MIYQSLNLSFTHHTVPIVIGENIYADPLLLAAHIHGPRVLIVTQQNIAALHLEKLQHALAEKHCDIFFLPCGEQYKDLASWQRILDKLIQGHHDRTTTLIALGGGVIGDITGFAAACFQRGVNYLQIPTTLIAQVDAAIGGKTAVNHALGKNLIGTVYQPQCVIVDVALLQTLPDREFNAGLAEVVKHGLALDADFFQWLENNAAALTQRNAQALLYAVYQSIRIKGNIVTQDEHDAGIRNLLNFGHTIGHALETASAYQQFLHGEAVAIGMVFATQLSVQLSGLSAHTVERVTQLLKALHLPVSTDLPPREGLLTLLQRDKKVRAGKLNFILLKNIGEAFSTTQVTHADITSLYADEKKEATSASFL